MIFLIEIDFAICLMKGNGKGIKNANKEAGKTLGFLKIFLMNRVKNEYNIVCG